MNFESFTKELDAGLKFWVHQNKLGLQTVFTELVAMDFPDTVPAKLFSRNVGATKAKRAAFIFGYSKLANPFNKCGVWPGVGFMYVKGKDRPGLKED